MITRRFRVSGRVQGVGYRAALQDEARLLHVDGWVRNRRDGSVEALAQGNPEAVEALMAWARQGPRGSRVQELSELPATPEDAAPCAGFEIRPTL
jgi:acylphosphatase